MAGVVYLVLLLFFDSIPKIAVILPEIDVEKIIKNLNDSAKD